MALERNLQKMPADVLTRLEAQKLLAAYDARPPYQRNDYLSWITRAKRPATREKRLTQMLDELAGGVLYMKMKWHGSARGL